MTSDEEIPDESIAISSTLPLASANPGILCPMVPKSLAPNQTMTASTQRFEAQCPKSGGVSHRTSAAALPRPNVL